MSNGNKKVKKPNTNTKKINNNNKNSKVVNAKKNNNKNSRTKLNINEKVAEKKSTEITKYEKIDNEKTVEIAKHEKIDNEKTVEIEKTKNLNNKKVVEVNSTNKVDINLYINELFKEKKVEKKSHWKVILGIIIIALIILSLLIFFDEKDLNLSFRNTKKDNVNFSAKKSLEVELEDADRIPIFTFHRIVSDKYKNERYKNYEWVASVDVFEKQIKYLYDNGYQTISMDQFYCWYQKNCKFPKKTVMLTFDDGDDDNYYLVLPILKKYNFNGVVFVVGSRTKTINLDGFDETKNNYLTYDLLKKTKKEYPKLEYQSHTWNMHYVDKNGKEHVLNMSEEEMNEDFEKQEHFGFKYLAYPYGVYNELEMKVLEKYNYKLAFIFRKQGYATRESNKYEIPRIKVNGFSDVEVIKKWLDY